jgi:hypothetical protein
VQEAPIQQGARLVYSRFFDTQIGGRSANGIDGLLAVLENK